MATTRIIPMHRNKGKSIAQCLRARTDYVKNPEKTNGGELISAFACDPRTVDAEFLLSKKEYQARTGRAQKRDVIAYQVRQSFRPGEVSPEEANKIGYEFASRFLKGNHAFIVATHVDKAHIHNHIVWNSTALDCTHKFRNFWGSTRAVRQLSDTLCVEHGLSIIEQPKGKGMHYGEWLGTKKQPSHRDQLREAIDQALAQKPKDFDALLHLLRNAGYETKTGKQWAFRRAGQKRFIRLDTLGDGYSYEKLCAVLEGKTAHQPRAKGKVISVSDEKKISLLVDIQAKLQTGKGAGYAYWAKKFNLKQMAQTMNYLTEHGLKDYEELAQRAASASRRYRALSGQIKAAEKRMAEIAVLRTHILNYRKTRDIYVGYRQSGYSAKYYAAHEAEILLHKAAKKAFDELGVKKLPTKAELDGEYAKLISEKKAAYAEYHRVRNEMKELLTVKANVDLILGVEPEETKREKLQER